jgi:general secretion pathway protein M
MRQAINTRLSRRLLFLTFNAAAILFITLFAVAPVLSHFYERNDEISENVAQLSHFQSIARNTTVLMTEQTVDPFLPGTEDRLVSAELQASLKTITAAAGARFLGVHGLQATQPQPLQVVAVSLELEGSLQSIRDVVQAIETQTPFLFITSAELHHGSDSDETIIQAVFRVQGFMDGPRARLSELSPPMQETRPDSVSTTRER